MDFKERVYSVLFVSASGKFSAALQNLMPESRFSPVVTQTSISAAERAFFERNYDIVIINSPLSDDAGINFAIDVSQNKSTVVLLLVRHEFYAQVYYKVAQYGVFVLSKPTSESMITQAFDWLAVCLERLKKVEKKVVSTEEKMKEIRTVNRAKLLLIEKRSMTEAEAHSYIEKEAMNNCVKKSVIAEKIIKESEK